nr:serine/threonine-protein kinase [Methylomarinum sp. Ch1-1]MDP4521645.1 serine/threonine-protein kinase [Methylomarinum sp. Ch1-1]
MNEQAAPANSEPDDDRTRIAAPKKESAAIGEYYNKQLKIEGIVGQGGMGRVFLGYDESIGRRVAIKELLDFEESSASNSEELKNTFIHEAKLTGKLEHPGIIPIYALDKQKGDTPYYVMRYVRGETLETLLKNCALLASDKQLAQRLKLLDILIDVSETLAYAHAKGVIHRDLKPGNIIRGEFGETIVLDWGLAQVLDAGDNTYFYREALSHQRHTLNDALSTETLGTPCYMAPEQFNGEADKRSDVYSLGVILFRIITGKLPYRGDFDTIQQAIGSDSPSPHPDKLEKSAPPELVAICNKALQKNRHLRFANAKEMAEQLKAFRDGRIVNIYEYSRKELLRRFLARNKALIFMSLALLTAILAGAGFSVHYAIKMQQAKAKVENSLVTITTFSETAQKQAQLIATAIDEGSAQLFSDLNAAARQLATSKLEDPANSQAILTDLHSQYPKFERFTVKPAANISSVSSSHWKSSKQEFKAPMAEMQNRGLRLFFRAPIIQNQHVDYVLEAVMSPEKSLPDLFPMTAALPGHSRDIWIISEDGLIVYDKNNRYLGSNLFLDPQNQYSPSLLAFGRLTQTDDEGIGYYSFIEDQQQIFKIAAWERVSFSPSKSWTVIVNYSYMSRPARN